MVTYGGMSLKPLTVGTVRIIGMCWFSSFNYVLFFKGTLIFKDLRFVGYWNSKWLETNARGDWCQELMLE